MSTEKRLVFLERKIEAELNSLSNRQVFGPVVQTPKGVIRYE